MIRKKTAETTRKILSSTLLTLCLGIGGLTLPARPVLGEHAVPGDTWRQYVDAKQAGFDPVQLEAARAMAEEMGSGSVMVVTGGQVVAAWGDLERPFRCHSIRKSLLSVLYGRPVEDGVIDLDATLAELGVDDTQGLTDAEKQATVEMLLQSRSGVYHPAAKEPRDMKENRPARGSHAPGTHFWYNNWDFNTAGSVYERLTGKGIFEAFEQEIARPAGMQDFRRADTFYQYERSVSRTPGYTFRLSARDAARFGLLALRRGDWGGRSLVPAGWFDRSFEPYSETRYGHYGYMWWIYRMGSQGLACYAASGMGGHLVAVIPEADLVMVHRADTDFGKGVPAGKVWELVYAIVNARTSEPLTGARTEPLQPIPFAKALPPLEIPETITLPAGTLDRYVGEYQIGPEMRVSMERIDDVLVGNMPGFRETDFFPVTETRFYAKAGGAFVDFELNPDGSVKLARVRMMGRTMVATPVHAEIGS